ncbi:hypothetical protein EPA93_02820 [Ktedonosporobacter rubrisoli]|uniref:Uncharacterized protein n=1 Tax=Ktedonosporobacter rubrisoli TaxID=2509675 RepID=A0A4V0YY49_KTERU|nr:hypothetical protein [Ktedonosporobacter rubrisoli]QBD74981.1 hypothetical protein EPA93_02820 [Ktedonosporobacter rubrisoli]
MQQNPFNKPEQFNDMVETQRYKKTQEKVLLWGLIGGSVLGAALTALFHTPIPNLGGGLAIGLLVAVFIMLGMSAQRYAQRFPTLRNDAAETLERRTKPEIILLWSLIGGLVLSILLVIFTHDLLLRIGVSVSAFCLIALLVLIGMAIQQRIHVQRSRDMQWP